MRGASSVVVAARDEAGVVPALVEDLAAQDYRDARGRPLKRAQHAGFDTGQGSAAGTNRLYRHHWLS